MDIAELSKNVSVILAALALISGINAWKREFIGKRKIELAEDTLMLFYQARDAIRQIRNPFARIDEGNTRQAGTNETDAEKELLNQAYVVQERYQKQEDVFNKLRAIKYRFMARFGKEHEEPFTELNKILNDIFSSARLLGSHYWQRQGRVKMDEEGLQRHLKEMREYEAVFWFQGEDRDTIGPRVDKAIKGIEDVTKSVLADEEMWFKKLF